MSTESPFAIEGTNVVIRKTINEKIDSDGDGNASIQFESANKITVNGFELIDEVLKGKQFFDYVKEKVGLGSKA